MQAEILREKLNPLFLAVFFNDLVGIQRFKAKNPNIFAQCNRFPLENEDTFDLYYLTELNAIIWNSKDWKEDILPFVKARRKETQEVLDFWQGENGFYRGNTQLKFSDYWEYLYCEDPAIRDYTNWEENSYFLDKGIKELDLMLYNRASCFDFKATRYLLKMGANPNIDLYEEEEQQDSIINHIAMEAANLSLQIIPLFESFEKNKYQENFHIINMFRDLLGYAAHEEMYKTLKTVKPNKWMMQNKEL